MGRISVVQSSKRIVAVLRRLSSTYGQSLPELMEGLRADECDTDRTALRRMLNKLEAQGLVQVDRAGKTHLYKKTTSTTNVLPDNISPTQYMVNLLSLNLLSQLLPPVVLQTLQNSLATKKPSNNNAKDWASKIASVPGVLATIPPSVDPDVLSTASDALQFNRILRITYRKPGGDEWTRDVKPLGLVQQDGALYLVVKYTRHSPLEDGIRHLALQRCKKVVSTRQAFTYPQDFSLKTYLRKKHFNYGHGQKMIISVCFTNKKTAERLTESPLPQQQLIEVTPEEGKTYWRLTATVDRSPLYYAWAETHLIDAGIISEEFTTLQD